MSEGDTRLLLSRTTFQKRDDRNKENNTPVRGQRYCVSFLLMAALAAPIGLGASPLQDDHRDDHRVYDREHKDYHDWDDHENRLYLQWEKAKHRTHHEFSKLSRKTQDEYWEWRHSHSDDDHDHR